MVVLPPGLPGRLKIFPALHPCLVRMLGQTRGKGDVFQDYFQRLLVVGV